MYLRFLEKDPSLPESWKSYFTALGEETDTVVKEIEGPTWKPNKKKLIFKNILKILKKIRLIITTTKKIKKILKNLNQTQ